MDVGTTNIKTALLTEKGISNLNSVRSPECTGSGSIREADAKKYLALCTEALSSCPEKVPVGLTCQRSSFVLWRRDNGEPVIPLISWMDTRASNWCNKNEQHSNLINQSTGLVLSPHYAGPKLATLLQSQQDLSAMAKKGQLCFGTLDSWLIWNWTKGSSHVIEVAMAARTLMMDLSSLQWSDDLLNLYGVPESMLPEIIDSCELNLSIGSQSLRALLTDQASACLSTLEHGNSSLVNLGTGGFILKRLEKKPAYIKGYLSGPLYKHHEQMAHFYEGTINGIAKSVDSYFQTGFNNCTLEHAENTFCMPESAGYGSPHWKPDGIFKFTSTFEGCSPFKKYLTVLEGICFRIHQILQDLTSSNEKIYLSGGLSHHKQLRQLLANTLQKDVFHCEQEHSSLVGILRAAAGVELKNPHLKVENISPEIDSPMPEKYFQWLDWANKVIES